MSEKGKRKICLTGMQLKYIAMITMLIDHIADCIIFPIYKEMAASDATSVTPYLLDLIAKYLHMRMIGRLAFPLYCFLIAEGVRHSKHLKRYTLSLWIFAMISEIPFDLAAHGKLFMLYDQNVFFTLALSVTAYCIIKNTGNSWIKRLVFIVVPLIASLLKTDYGAVGVLALYVCMFGGICMNALAGTGIIFYGICRLFDYDIVSFIFSGLISAIYIFLIYAYNGKRGKVYGNKYIYYAFYPVHLLILGIIRIFFF